MFFLNCVLLFYCPIYPLRLLQPEHCVAWAKSRFETYFSSEVQLVAKLRGMINPLNNTSSTSATSDADAPFDQPEAAKLEQVRAWLGTLSEDQAQGVLRVLEDRPWTALGAQKVSIVGSTPYK